MDKIELEGIAFDNQIKDRINNGYIPDLRKATPCEYFYNNTWRHPDYVELDVKEQFLLVKNIINKEFDSNVRILEIGCGPGHFSLELARSGYDVMGIDVSKFCIEVAESYSDKDEWKLNRGLLEYQCVDFFELSIKEKFDVIIFIGAMHHFNDIEKLLIKVKKHLNKNGIIIAHEPTRDRVSKKNASIAVLIKSILSILDGYYLKIDEILIEDDLEKSIDMEYFKLRYELEDGSKVQSVNDNESGFIEMISGLRANFKEVYFEERYAIFHELIGGLRFEQEVNKKIAKLIHDFDNLFCNQDILDSTEFIFVGRI